MGKVSTEDRQRFYRSLNARGWKVNEAGSDKIPPETPELARSIGEMLISKAGLSREQAATLIGHRTAANETIFLAPEKHLRAV